MITIEHKKFYDRKVYGTEPPEPQAMRAARRLNMALRSATEADKLIRTCQRRWMGDPSERSVLEVGSYIGNALTPVIAAESRRYRGIDISTEAVAVLADRLAAAGYDHAEAQQADVMTAKLGGPWDIVYAHGVLHHFSDLRPVLDRLAACLAPGGRLITFDPMRTSVPIRVARTLYRPIQRDAALEFPFDRAAFAAITKRFEITVVQGILGRAKWAVPLFLVPGLRRVAEDRLQRWHARDTEMAAAIGPDLWRCMSAALCCERH